VFSGLVASVGEVHGVHRRAGGARLELRCALPGEPVAAGESIAVQGVCLTAVAPETQGFSADLSPETLSRSTLGAVRKGDRVNLERSLRLDTRIGGHLVMGHVDATTQVVAVRPSQDYRTLRFALPATVAREVAEKGSVAVDGVSLTVSALGEGWFEVALIPTTLTATTLGSLRPGHKVNLETDVLAKYVRRALGGERPGIASLLAGLPDAQD
jgi:riboflavin synthase